MLNCLNIQLVSMKFKLESEDSLENQISEIKMDLHSRVGIDENNIPSGLEMLAEIKSEYFHLEIVVWGTFSVGEGETITEEVVTNNGAKYLISYIRVKVMEVLQQAGIQNVYIPLISFEEEGKR